MTVVVIAVVLLLLLIAVISIARTPAQPRVRERPHGGRPTTGLPGGEIVYSDADSTARPLVARRYPLTGKPDYVVRTSDGRHVPVELKSGHALRGRRGHEPRHEDVLQLVAYMIILDDLHDEAPRYGLLRYADATFEVPYADDLRGEVLDVLAAMQALDDAAVPDGKPDLSKCRACAFKEICDNAVV